MTMALDFSSDRAQMGPSPRWPAFLLTGSAVLAVVIAEMRNEIAAADFSQVESVCGLCGATWPPSAQLLVITLVMIPLVIVAKWLVGGPQWPAGGEDADE